MRSGAGSGDGFVVYLGDGLRLGDGPCTDFVRGMGDGEYSWLWWHGVRTGIGSAVLRCWLRGDEGVCRRRVREGAAVAGQDNEESRREKASANSRGQPGHRQKAERFGRLS